MSNNCPDCNINYKCIRCIKDCCGECDPSKWVYTCKECSMKFCEHSMHTIREYIPAICLRCRDLLYSTPW